MQQLIQPTEMQGNEAIRFANEHLSKVKTDASGWEIEYFDPQSGDTWMLDYPNGSYHGGGSPRLRNMRVWEAHIDRRLHAELWTSWASLLRSYAAAHGMNSTQHAVVEVSAEEITLRVGSRWLRFTQDAMLDSEGGMKRFALTEDGNVRLEDAAPEEMDFAAERLAREMMS